MSFDVKWERFDSDMAQEICDTLNGYFKDIALPEFIGGTNVWNGVERAHRDHGFDFGLDTRSYM